MMRYKVLLFFLLVLWVAQTAKSQDVALKTNTLMWATTTPNLGLEVALSPRYTLELSGSYNPWTFKDDKKMRFWLVQPELKYWFCEKSEGHFVGMHLHGAQYFGGFKKKRYACSFEPDLLPQYVKYDNPNYLRTRIKLGVCELCGENTGDICMHHVKSLKSIKADNEWNTIMLAKRRKTLAVCPNCYAMITK